jgi:glutathione S-transferase
VEQNAQRSAGNGQVDRPQRMQIFSGPLSMFGAKVQIAAHEKAIAFDLVMVPFDMKRRYEPKHPEVLRINPKRQVPVVIDGAVEIFDSTQIFEYLEHAKPEPPLWPPDTVGRARARLLEHKSDEIYFPHIIRLMELWATPEHPTAVAARQNASAYYREMEAALAGREYLAGAYSYADIAFYMAQLFGTRMNAEMTRETPKLLEWRERITARSAVRRVVEPMAEYIVSQHLKLPDFLSHLATGPHGYGQHDRLAP